MLTYVYFGTNDLQKAIAFYDAVLTPLGMERCVTGDPECWLPNRIRSPDTSGYW